MPTSTLTYKNNSHKSKKRSKSVSKKHKNSKRKHYSNKKNNMRGGSGFYNSVSQKFTNPLYLNNLNNNKEHDANIIKEVKEELKDLTSTTFRQLLDVSKPNLFYDETLPPETKEKMRNDFKNNKLDTFRRILQLGEDFMELSTKKIEALKSYNACTYANRYKNMKAINDACKTEKITFVELQTQIKRMEHIFRQFGLGGFLSKSTPEELIKSKTIFTKIVSSINDDNIIIYKMSQKNDEPNPIGNSNNEIF